MDGDLTYMHWGDGLECHVPFTITPKEGLISCLSSEAFILYSFSVWPPSPLGMKIIPDSKKIAFIPEILGKVLLQVSAIVVLRMSRGCTSLCLLYTSGPTSFFTWMDLDCTLGQGEGCGSGALVDFPVDDM